MSNKKLKTSCSICHTEVVDEFKWEHCLSHAEIYPYKCNYMNCSSEFSSEVLLDLHCDMKHEGIKSKRLQSDNEVDTFLKNLKTFIGLADFLKLLNFDPNLHKSSHLQVVEAKINKKLDITVESLTCRLKRNKEFKDRADSKKYKWKHILAQMKEHSTHMWEICSKCRKEIEHGKETCHVLNHMMDNGEIDSVYECVMCCTNSTYTTAVEGFLFSHLKVCHRISKPKRHFHYKDKSDKYVNIAKLKLFDYFPHMLKNSELSLEAPFRL